MKNLDSFKLNKKQMGMIAGGKTRCVSYNRDTDEMKHYEYDDKDVAEAREDVIEDEVNAHNRVNVACWNE